MGHSNARNLALVLLVPLPSLVFYWFFLVHSENKDGLGLKVGREGHGITSWQWGDVCAWGKENPFYLVNVLLLLNFDILFWIIGVMQGSVWLVDPYWTFIPVLIVHYFAAHPSASGTDQWRSRAVISLIWLWSIRLTYSYLRREHWNWGEREDWRFTDLRKSNGKHWWWTSFFIVFISQHIFLVGITLPLYTVYGSPLPANFWDVIATFLCVLGISIAHFADSQLNEFMNKNSILKDIGAPKVQVLNTGLWYYSRHPNYFGEQLFWWGLSLFAWNVGQGWAVIGTVINSACLAYVTVLVENRMLLDKSRAVAYRQYQQSTSVLFPWFKRNTINNAKGKAKAG